MLHKPPGLSDKRAGGDDPEDLLRARLLTQPAASNSVQVVPVEGLRNQRDQDGGEGDAAHRRGAQTRTAQEDQRAGKDVLHRRGVQALLPGLIQHDRVVPEGLQELQGEAPADERGDAGDDRQEDGEDLLGPPLPEGRQAQPNPGHRDGNSRLPDEVKFHRGVLPTQVGPDGAERLQGLYKVRVAQHEELPGEEEDEHREAHRAAHIGASDAGFSQRPPYGLQEGQHELHAEQLDTDPVVPPAQEPQ